MDDLAKFLIATGVVLFIFLICREIVCWYFKLNKINATLTEIRDLLQRNIEADKSE